MVINENPEEAIYANIDRNIKDRVISFITESKLSGNKKTDSIKGLIEEALDEYMMNHPISRA